MSARQIGGLVLIALGVLALIYGGFTYTEETHDLELGPIELEVKEKNRIHVPVWVGVVAVVAGAVVLIIGRNRR